MSIDRNSSSELKENRTGLGTYLQRVDESPAQKFETLDANDGDTVHLSTRFVEVQHVLLEKKSYSVGSIIRSSICR